jgi:hypothetical protein
MGRGSVAHESKMQADDEDMGTIPMTSIVAIGTIEEQF